jgi:hypothetical protein
MPKNLQFTASRVECSQLQRRSQRVVEEAQSLAAGLDFIVDLEIIIELCRQENMLDDS